MSSLDDVAAGAAAAAAAASAASASVAAAAAFASAPAPASASASASPPAPDSSPSVPTESELSLQENKDDPELEPAPSPAPDFPAAAVESSTSLSTEPQTHAQSHSPLSQLQSQPNAVPQAQPQSEPEPPASLPAHVKSDHESGVGSESESAPASASASAPAPAPEPEHEPVPDTSAAVAALQESLHSDHQHQSYGQHDVQHNEEQPKYEKQEQQRQPNEYDGLPGAYHVPGSLVPVSAVAHHGLQALQAASADPSPITSSTSNHMAQQYAQSATLQMGDAHYGQAAADIVNGHQPSPLDLHIHPHHTQPQAQAHNYAHGHAHGHAVSPIAPGPSPGGTPTSNSQKVTRLRRACDMCSQRKVKCDESGPPCKPCADLNVECTFQRQMKRRGPPNKHAEAARAAKRTRVDGHDAIPDLLPSLSPQQDVQSTLQPTLRATLDAEAIAPWPVLELLVDDFFTYIHPLIPFPHQPTFRQAFVARADRTSRKFLALLASMIGILVASFPRSARSHLKAQHSTNLFPTSITMIERCRDVALEARGPFFMAAEEMTVEDAATSYLLGLTAAYTLRWKPCKRFMAETMTFVREVSVHRNRGLMPGTQGGDITSSFGVPSNKPVDHIKDQMTKRIFWVIVAGVRSMTQLGASINDLPLPPPTSQEQYPDQPVEVDDEFIYTDQILPQPEGIPSLITGFNRNICVYTTMNELVGVDMCYGMKFFDWSAQKNILSNGLSSAKQATEDLPLHLQVKTEPGQPEPPAFDYAGMQYHPPAFPAAQPSDDVRHAFAEEPMRRRQLQFEIQKANIYASSLATRSYFVERYLNLRDAERQRRKAEEGVVEEEAEAEAEAKADADADLKDERDAMVASERELIVRNLLTVLTSISQRNLEPNGGSIIYKIRQVASTLLNDAPERKGPVAVQAEEYLAKFLDILMRLEKTGGASASASGASASGASGVPTTMTARDEEEELQCWASLRDYQHEFAVANGGFLGNG